MVFEAFLATLRSDDQVALEDRELLHYRASLIQEQTRLKNRIIQVPFVDVPRSPTPAGSTDDAI